MPKNVSEIYPELWHYTTANGLHGILTSQELWATDILYLNDNEEFTGFFDRKLPSIISTSLEKAIISIKDSQLIEDEEEREKYISSLNSNYIDEVTKSIKKITLMFQVYVSSFCAAKNPDDSDGLLSQWRGYGTDGGYAIALNTQKMEELLAQEHKKNFYSFSHWGDADYHDHKTTHEETLEWESKIQDVIIRIVQDIGGSNYHHIMADLFDPILSLSTRHKHHGFEEEREVRVAAVTSMTDKIPEAAKVHGESRPEKKVHFRIHNGMFIPYIRLFESEEEQIKLPINKIIVGPHPDKQKRKKSVEKLLNQLSIDTEVITSDIPYIG